MLNFAIIGCGHISRLHAQRVQADGRARISALFDVNRSAAAALSQAIGGSPPAYHDLDTLLAAGGLDAAIVCTPTAAHFDQVRACRARGLHVLCEKPLADTRERIVTLIDESRLGGPRLSVAYQRRYWSTYRTLRREVLSGRWGRVRAISSHSVENWQATIAGTWRDDPQVNFGGFIADAGSHKLDAIFYVTGLRPVQVFANTATYGSRVEIVATSAALLEGGVPMSADFIGNAQYLGEELHVHCERADWIVRDERLWIAQGGPPRLYEELERDSNPNSGFIELIEGQGPDLAPPECALPVFDFTRALLESGRTGQVVRL
jgi:predicted dehydrogenase